MNEHDSKEAHKARNADAKRIASEYAHCCGLAHEEALEQLLQHAWECGFEFNRRNDNGK